MKTFIISATLLFVMGFFSVEAYSSETKQPEKYVSGYLGLGVAALPDYEGSDDFQAVPLISGKVNYKQYYFETRGLGGRINISPTDLYDFGPAFSYKMERDDDMDSNALGLFREIDSSFMAGAFLKIPVKGITNPYDQLSFDADILSDTSGTSDGFLVSFGPSYSLPVSRVLRFSTSLSATYADDNYMNTYFGVDANNAARSGLAQYEADGGFKDAGMTFTTNYQFNEKWGVLGLVSYKRLLSEAADSPIVEEEGSANQFMIGTGVSYRF